MISTLVPDVQSAAMKGATFAARLRAVEREALEAVVHTYLRQVLRAAQAAGLSPERAEDVTQATFMTLLEVAPRFEGRSHVRAFLFGILHNKIAESRRKMMMDRQMDSIDSVVGARFAHDGHWQRSPRSVDLQLHHRDIRATMDRCFDGVTERQKTAFVLREVEGLETEAACRILHVTRKNLGVLLYRARNRLRESLETTGRMGGDHNEMPGIHAHARYRRAR